MKKKSKKSNESFVLGLNFNDVINILASLDLAISCFSDVELDDFHIGELRDLVVLKDKIYTLLD